MEILTSTNFISTSYCFPPIKSRERMKRYKNNLEKYKGEYNKDRQLRVKTSEGYKVVDIPVPSVNYFKLTTEKQLGLLLNEKPIMSLKEEDLSRELNKLIVDCKFFKHLQDAVRSFYSLGDGVVFVYKDANGNPCLNAVNPELWYKVVNACDINDVKCHVLVQPIYKENYYETLIEDTFEAIRILYHYKGYYIEKYFSYDGVRIGYPIEMNDVPKDGKKVETGLKDFAVVDFNNSRAIDEIYGVSDYKIFEDALMLKEKKLAQLDAVLDKHFDPILTVPKSSIRQNNETGKQEFNGLGNIMAITKDDKVEYISWDAKTDAILGLIDALDKEVATLSELGKTFLNGEYANASGEALKVMIKSALDKTSRTIDTLESAVKTILCNLMYLKGVTLEPNEISIEWQDGIVDGMLLQAQAIDYRRKSGTLSKKRAIMKFDGLTAEQADVEIDLINKENNVRGVAIE